MRVVILEDDLYQREWLEKALKYAFQEVSVVTLATEREFREWVASVEQGSDIRPDLVVLDNMVRWDRVSRNSMTAPDDVRVGRFYQAGSRCQAMLQSSAALSDVPTIMYSVMEPDEATYWVSSQAAFVTKSDSSSAIIKAVSRLAGFPGRRTGR